MPALSPNPQSQAKTINVATVAVIQAIAELDKTLALSRASQSTKIGAVMTVAQAFAILSRKYPARYVVDESSPIPESQVRKDPT